MVQILAHCTSVTTMALTIVAGICLLPSDIQGQSTSSITLLGKTVNKTFYSTKHLMTWDNAGIFCEEYGFQRASIESPEEQKIFDNLVEDKIEAIEWYGFWLDATGSVATNEWKWDASGKPLEYSNWETEYPTTINGIVNSTIFLETCGYIFALNGTARWQDVACRAEAANPLCMLRKPCDTAAVVPSTTSLPPSTTSGVDMSTISTYAPLSDLQYVGYPSAGSGITFYWNYNVILNWTESRAFCAKYGLELASIETKEEHAFINQWAAGMGYEYSVIWLSGRYARDFPVEWEWANTGHRIPMRGEGPPGFQDWADGSPALNRSEDLTCLAATLDNASFGTWQSIRCSGACRPLCVKRDGASTTAAVSMTTGTAVPLPDESATTDATITITTGVNLITVGKLDSGEIFYTRYNTFSNETEAKKFCEAVGLELAVIDDVNDLSLTPGWLDWTGNQSYFISSLVTPSVGGSSCVTANPSKTALMISSCPAQGAYPLCMGMGSPATTSTVGSTIPIATTSSPSDLIYVGTSDSGKIFYTDASSLLTSAQTLEFCRSHGLQVAAIETVQEGAFISAWATGEALRDWINYVASGDFLRGPANSIQTLNCVVSSFVGVNPWTSFECQPYGRPLCTLSPTIMTTTIPPTTSLAPTTTAAVNQVNDLPMIGTVSTATYTKVFFGQRVSSDWATAAKVCKDRGLEFATIESQADQDVLDQFATTNSSWSAFWTSGTDEADDGNWKWAATGRIIPLSGGSAFGLYENWATSPPPKDGNCLVIYLFSWVGKNWHPAPCIYQRPTLCMKKVEGRP